MNVAAIPANTQIGGDNSSLNAREFREPFRSRFIAVVKEGAASRDIHDVAFPVAYAKRSRPSASFLKRELERPYAHAQHICRWIQHLAPVERILDVGCGTAGLSLALAWTFPQATIDCFDADECSLHAAGLRIEGYGLADRIRPQLLAPNSVFPLESGQFDLVTCTSVLEFITSAEDRCRLLSEMRRVVRPDGHIVITTPNFWYPFELHSRRFAGNWYRRAGFPWASRIGWIHHQLPDCEFPILAGRIASKLRMNVPQPLCRAIERCLPWQFVLAHAR
jgi:2-polyprenyl-3-methyl-5-hydroxy-6-metoxy-1,4-benzoquinol methylase